MKCDILYGIDWKRGEIPLPTSIQEDQISTTSGLAGCHWYDPYSTFLPLLTELFPKLKPPLTGHTQYFLVLRIIITIFCTMARNSGTVL